MAEDVAEPRFRPYADDAAVRTVGDLAVENGRARVVLHGDLEIPRDRAGLARARALKGTLDAIVRALERDERAGRLPEAVDDAPEPPATVPNPFA